MDERILVALRDAEQSGRINTIAVSIYPHKWLKEKWKKIGQLLHVSNYGDHKRLDVYPYSLADLSSMYSKKGIPDALIRMMYEWTGGIPECIDHVLERWSIGKSRSLDPHTQQDLKHVAQTALERIAENVDPV
jgi:hypothetical protein